MTLRQIVDGEYDEEVVPEIMIEFATEGAELDAESDYLDEILETHGDKEVAWYNKPSASWIKVLFKKEN